MISLSSVTSCDLKAINILSLLFVVMKRVELHPILLSFDGTSFFTGERSSGHSAKLLIVFYFLLPPHPIIPPTSCSWTTCYHLFPVPSLLSRSTNVKGQVTKKLSGQQLLCFEEGRFWGCCKHQCRECDVCGGRGWSQDIFVLRSLTSPALRTGPWRGGALE